MYLPQGTCSTTQLHLVLSCDPLPMGLLTKGHPESHFLCPFLGRVSFCQSQH